MDPVREVDQGLTSPGAEAVHERITVRGYSHAPVVLGPFPACRPGTGATNTG
jgi:hypothetical protein